jgi:hypothetical protein
VEELSAGLQYLALGQQLLQQQQLGGGGTSA